MRRPTRRARIVIAVVAVTALVGSLVASVVVSYALAAELAAVREVALGAGDGDAALPSGPVMVLGGGAQRVEAALALDAVDRDGRELIASAGAADDLVLFARTCDDAGIRCVSPDPATTRGEARLAARLAEQERWTALTVVTSSWHAHRAARHFSACLAIPVRVLPVRYATLESVPRRLLWREAIGALDARLRPECADRDR